MNADRRRILLVLGVLALIAVFVVGAIELATKDRSTDKPTETTATQPADKPAEQAVAESATADNAQDRGVTSSVATGPAVAGTDEELPSTGVSPFVAVIALSLLILSGVAYARSRRHLQQTLLHNS